MKKKLFLRVILLGLLVLTSLVSFLYMQHESARLDEVDLPDIHVVEEAQAEDDPTTVSMYLPVLGSIHRILRSAHRLIPGY